MALNADKIEIVFNENPYRSLLSAIFFVAALVLGSACTKPPAVAPVPTPEPTLAVLMSLETKRITADGFSIVVPASFKDEPWQGVDSSGWSFKGKGMTISMETWGGESRDFGYLNYRETQEIVDGELCKIAMYGLPMQKGLIDPAKRNYVVGYFNTSKRVREELSVSARFETPKDEQLALQIIESIKFEQSSK